MHLTITRNTGFTLIEVMVVIAILAVLSGVSAYSYFGGLPERRLLAASRVLYTGIKNAQSEAVNRGEDVTISFDLKKNSFTISDENDNEIASHVFPPTIDLYEITKKGTDFTFNYRGMMKSQSSIIRIGYFKTGPLKRGVRLTTAGGISLIDETDSNWGK